MSEVIELFPAKRAVPKDCSHSSVTRLHGIARTVATMDVSNLRTHEDIMRTIWQLDLANHCIGIVLSEFRGDPATDHLIGLAEKLIASIDHVRSVMASLRPAILESAIVGAR